MARKIPIGLQHLWHDTYQEIISISMRNLDFFTDIDIKGFRVQGFKGSGFRGSRVQRFSPARRECGKYEKAQGLCTTTTTKVVSSESQGGSSDLCLLFCGTFEP